MTDDIWRHDEGSEGSARRPGRFESQMDDFNDDEFGGPLFGDDSGGVSSTATTGATDRVSADPSGPGLSFDDDDTGSLPHWTEPPTGEMPKIEAAGNDDSADEDLDVWSTFTSESPVWKEGDSVDAPSGTLTRSDDQALPSDPTGELSWEDDPSSDIEVTGSTDVVAAAAAAAAAAPTAMTETVDAVAPREPARITIGTDPSGMPRRPEPTRRGGPPQRPPTAGVPTGSDKRNLPVAVFSGLLLAAVFLGLTMFVGPLGSLIFVAVALAIAGVEYFGKVTEKGYRPAVAPGVVAIVAAPLAGYWLAEFGLPLVIVFAFMAGSIGFIGASSIESGPMPNMAITMLGVIWIGLMGSYAGMLLDWSNGFGGGTNWGTDTLVLLAIGVVANDVGAYFVGSAFGRTPLRGWISPAKSVEGFLGGAVLTLIVMVIIGLQEWSDTWSDMSHLLMLGVVILILAPLGDLTESMFKRNLDVKDFGTLISGHGGVLDRFDGFLFTLPAVYYLFRVVEPYAAL
ncbi:phosphatidate cytidylyltransferase [Ilumatobacter coccineus]|nr:phosphatidate cytidylyltransferase [Ilumatobacter coccineus]